MPALKRNPRKFTMATRRLRVMQLRTAGYTLQQIADQVGCGKATVSRDLDFCLQDLADQQQDQTTQLRTLSNYLLDMLLQKFLPLALQGDGKAADRVLRINKQKRDLYKLDVPEPVAETAETERDTTQGAQDLLGVLLQANPLWQRGVFATADGTFDEVGYRYWNQLAHDAIPVKIPGDGFIEHHRQLTATYVAAHPEEFEPHDGSQT